MLLSCLLRMDLLALTPSFLLTTPFTTGGVNSRTKVLAGNIWLTVAWDVRSSAGTVAKKGIEKLRD